MLLAVESARIPQKISDSVIPCDDTQPHIPQAYPEEPAMPDGFDCKEDNAYEEGLSVDTNDSPKSSTDAPDAIDPGAPQNLITSSNEHNGLKLIGLLHLAAILL